MCDPFTALFGGIASVASSLFGGKKDDTSAVLKAQLAQQQADARSANEKAAQSALDASEKQKSALVQPADSEYARQQAEIKQRRLLGAQGPNADTSAAPTKIGRAHV